MVKRIILLFLIPFYSFAQGWEFSDIKPLDGVINSDGEELFPLLSPNGKTFYFSRLLYAGNQGGKYTGSDIWISNFDDNKKSWSKPVSAEKLNSRGSNAVVGINADGKSIYIMSTNSSDKPSGIYITRKTGSIWSKPELVPIPNLEAGGFLNFYVSPDFEVIFISMKGKDTKGEEDLYVSTKSTTGEWSVPKNLGSSVNTTGFEISPFLSQDKKRLYFSSNGHKGFGDADILYCDRLYNSWDTWSAAKNLGDKLNSKSFDAYFTMYGDSIAYFSSSRGGKLGNIYSVRVVPGNDVLAYGQQYLKQDEITKMLGGNILRKIVFEGKTTELNANQKELIYYIANKISLLRDVNVQLSVTEDNMPDISEQRLKNIVNQFRESGLDNFRIVLTNNDRIKKPNPTQAIVDILFFK
jgi:hypothetical protein